MATEFSYQLGTHRGRAYELTVRVSPDLDRVREFAVTLHYGEDGSRVEVARIDSSHSQVHFDRLYRRDQPKELLDVDVREAAALLEADWRRYARSYDRAHGDRR